MNTRSTSVLIQTMREHLYKPATWLALFAFILFGNDLAAQTVQKRLYLSSGGKLDRVDPAATAGTAALSTVALYKDSVFVDFSTNGKSNSATSSLTLNHVTGSQSRRILLVGIATPSRNIVSSVTYGGSTNLTRLYTKDFGTSGQIQLWYLANPTASSPSTTPIAINLSSSSTVIAGSVTLYNVTQNFLQTTLQELSFSSTNSISYKAASSSGDFILDVLGVDGAVSLTPGTGQTALYNDGVSGVQGAASYKRATLDSTSMSWSRSNATDWGVVYFPVKGEAPTAEFTLDPTLCQGLTLPAGGTISLSAYATVTQGTMPSSVAVTAHIKKGANIIKTLTTATWNGTTLTWTGTMDSTVTIPAGSTVGLVIANDITAARFTIQYDGTSTPSYLSLPTTTYINVGSADAYTTSGGSTTTNTVEGGRTVYLRATASDPFGYSDITGIDFQVTPSGGSTTTYAGVLQSSSGCSSTYEYAWTPNTIGTYTINAVAKEGTEGTVTHTRALPSFSVTAPPFEVDHTLVSPLSGLYKPGDTLTYQIIVRNLSGTKTIPTLPLQSLYNAGCLQYLRTPSGYPILTDSSAGAITWNNLAPLAASSTATVRAQFKVVGECAPARNIARAQGAVFSDGYVISTTSDTVDLTIDNYPLAVNDSVCLSAMTTISVLANDSDPDTTGAIGATGSSYTVQIVTSPTKGTASVVGKTIQYTPASLSENELTTFTYRVLDATGLADTATIAVRYSVTNDAPVAAADASTAIANVPKIVAVLNNDSDADGTLQTLSITAQPTYGRVSINADKTITYTSFIGYTGLDEFTYQICDNGCPGAAACATATVTMDVLEGYVFCDDSTNTLTTPAVAGATKYSWTFPAGVSPVTGTTISTSPNVVVETTTPEIQATWSTVTTGTFFPVCVAAINDCGAGTTTCLRMMVNRLSATLDSTDAVCYGQKSGAIDLEVSGGSTPYTYSWSNGVKSQDLNAVGAGNYQVTVSDKFGCKYISQSISLSEPTQVSVSASITNQMTAVPADGALDITTSGGTPGYAYAWSNGYSVGDLSALEGGTYTLTVTDANGCTDTTSFTVPSNVIPLEISALVKTDVLCNGGMTGTIDLEVTGGNCMGSYTYSWSKDGGAAFATTQDLSGLGTGTYSVTVSCTGSVDVTGSITISQPASALSTSIASSTNLSCKDASDGAIDLTASGGTAPYSYYWNNTETTQDISSLIAGTYTVTTTDANGCTETETVTLTQPDSLLASAVATNATCTGQSNGALSVTVTGGTPNFALTWNNGSTSQTISGQSSITNYSFNNLRAGTYRVTVTDSKNCNAYYTYKIDSVCIGVAKSVVYGPVNNLDSTYTLTYQVKVKNTGSAKLKNVQVADTLSNTFPNKSFTVTGLSSSTLTTNSSYDGKKTGDPNLLTGVDSIYAGDSAMVLITVKVVPGSNLGPYNNFAVAIGTDPQGVVARDTSHTGTNPDPDNDGPKDNNDPTPITFTENPQIGVAKAIIAGPTNDGTGTYALTYRILVQNTGDVPIKNVQVADTLSKTFGASSVSVTSLSSPDLAENSAYNGRTTVNLLLGTDTMLVNEIDTILLSLTVRPTSAGPYNNFAVGTANGFGGTAVRDSSQTGSYPDPDQDGDPKDNNQETPVSFSENPSIGLAKRVIGTPVNNGNGTYSMGYEFIVKNTGDVTLKNVQIRDTLSVRFASATFTVDSLRSADMAVNSAYTGATGGSLSTALLLGTDSMTVGEQDTLRLYITVSPGSNLGPYNNQAKANATGQLGTSVEDYSNDGSDVDPENDGPDDNNTPSPITFTEDPELGVAKTILSGPTNNNDGTYTLTYRILVKNTGDVPLSNIQVRDSLNIVFGKASAFVVLSKSATSPLLVNTGFNGTSDNGLLASGSSLTAGQQGTIDLQIKVTPGQYLGPYNNVAYGRATSPVGTVVTDVSQDGTDVDPDSDGDPGNNNQVTPVTFVANPQVGIAKRVLSGPTLNTSNGSFRIAYRIRVENTGDVPLSNFQVEDDLALTFLEANSFSVYSIASALSSGGLTVNSSYDGSTNRFLYANGQTLPYQGKDSVTIVVDVYTGNSSKPYYNSAIAFGTSPSGTIVMDASQDGVQPNPDMDDTPRNNNVQTPVNLPRIVIGAAKQVLSGPTSVGDGTYTTTYQVRVKNMGGMDIYDMQLFDTLSSFGTYTASTPTQGGKYTISTAPSIAFISSGSALTTNSAFTGSGTQTSLLNFNAGDKLEIGDSLAVNFTVKFRPFKDTTYRNQVIATGDRFQDGDADRDAIDPSHEGTLIDPDGDGIPNQVRDTINEIFVGNNDTTKFSITLQSDLSLTKTVQALGNGKVKFTLTLRNNGPADSYNTMVEDSLSSGLAYDSHTAGKTFTYNSTTRVGVWNVGTIVPGADSTLEITCTLSTSPSLTTNHFRNFAQVSDSDQPDPDSTPDNDDPNEDDYAVAVPTVADLRLTKTSTVLANGNVKFTLRLYNDGPATAKTITVTDTLSSTGYTYISHSLGRYNPSTHLWSLDSLQSGRDSTLEIVVSLKNTIPFDATAYANKAQVDSTDAADPDSDPRNDDATEDDQASSTPKIADLSLSKTLKLLTNGNYRYRLVVFNEGPDTATNVSVLDTLPNGVMYVSDNGSGSYNSTTGIWTVGTIPKDSSKMLEIEVSAIAPTPGVTLNYKNIAQVYSSDQADPTSSPNNDDGDQSEDDEDSVLPSLDAHPDFNATFVNVPVSGTVTTNDNVPSGSTYGTSPTPSPSNPPGGQLTMNADGSYLFQSPYVGVYVYDVPVCPPGLSVPNCNSEKLTIHVLGYNQPNEPVANPDIATTLLDQNVTLSTLSNDRAGNIGGVLDPASVLVLYHNSAEGNPTVDPATGDITFDPASTFVGVTSYTYRVCDFSTPTPLCDTTFQEVTVIEPSDPNSTQAADDYAYTYSGVPVSGSVKTNDNDPQGHTQTVIAQDSAKAGIGRLVLGTNGSFTFTPVPGFHGPTYYTYQTCDNGSPVACHDATLYILVYPIDPTPDINATLVNVPVPGTVVTNDSVPPGTLYGTSPTPRPGNPTGGVLTMNANGSYSFVSPNPGVYVYDVPVCAPGNAMPNCLSETLTITVVDPLSPVPPIANPDVAVTSVDVNVILKTLSNDRTVLTGQRLDTASVTIVTAPLAAEGTATVNPATGEITFDPVPTFRGIARYTYAVCDNSSPALCDTTFQEITVISPSDPNSTFAADDFYATQKGVPVSGSAQVNDTDPQGHAQTITPQTTTVSGVGTLVLASNGSFTFTPESGFSGPTSYVYQTCDNGTPTACAEATIYLLVMPGQNDKPYPDLNVTYVNVPVPGSVRTNDTISSGTVYRMPVSYGDNPPGGVLQLNPDGTYTFVSPNPGVYYYDVSVCPGGATMGCPTTILKITVLSFAGPNPPVANPDIAQTLQNSPVTLKTLANDYPGDPDKALVPGTVSVISTVPANQGTTAVQPNGDIRFTPTSGFTGTVRYEYRVCDNHTPALCDTSFQEILILPAGAPNSTLAADDYVRTLSETPVSGSVLTNDTDPEGDSQTVTPQNITLAGKGTLQLASNGAFTFTPAPGFFGPISFPYRICDNNASVACADATLYILVSPMDPNPDINTTFVNVPIPGTVVTNDQVPPGTTYGTSPTPESTNPPGGVLVMNSNGTYTFRSPNKGVYVYRVPVCPPGVTVSCPLETLTITVIDIEAPNPPIANPDYAVTKKGVPVTLRTLANDRPGILGTALNPASVRIITTPGSSEGTASVHPATGDIVFTPVSGFIGKTRYTYQVCDFNAPTPLCAITFQEVTVVDSTYPNTTLAEDDFTTTQMGSPVSGSVKTNDTDPEGHTQNVVPQTTTTPGVGELVLQADGSYTFIPVPGFFGPASYTYTTCDNGSPVACASATLYILVAPFLPMPDINVTFVNKPIPGNVHTNDRVPYKTRYGTSPNPVPGNPPGGVLTMQPDGKYTFVSPNPGVYMYEVPVCPPDTSTNCPTTTLTITVLNDTINPPTINPDFGNTLQGQPITLNTLANDAIGSIGRVLDSMSVSILNPPSPSVGTVEVVNQPGVAKGSIRFVPAPGFTGVVRYNYRVCDLGTPVLCYTSYQQITVHPVVIPNTTFATDDYITIPSGTVARGNVLRNDVDPEGNQQIVVPIDTTIAETGRLRVSSDGSLLFESKFGFSGTVVVPYRLCDNHPTNVACASATIYIAVTKFDPNPDINATFEGIPIEGSVKTNDQVPQGTTYGTSPTPHASNPSGATLTMNTNGQYVFTNNRVGIYVYDVPTCPPGYANSCLNIRLTITVLSLNGGNRPVTHTDIATIKERTLEHPQRKAVLRTLANDASEDAGVQLVPSSVVVTTPLSPTIGTTSVDPATGDITFIPAIGFTGVVVYNYQICDDRRPFPLCDTAIQKITVLPDDSPNVTSASDDYARTTAGVSVSGSVRINDNDPEDNNQFIVPLDTTVGAGRLTLRSQLPKDAFFSPKATARVGMDQNGSYTFTPARGFFGPVSFVYQVCDDGNPRACANATLYILVTAAPELDCACRSDVHVTLDPNSCSFELKPSMVSSAKCAGATVIVQDNNPSNKGIIDCPGTWKYALFNTYGDMLCWGEVIAEDKSAPLLQKVEGRCGRTVQSTSSPTASINPAALTWRDTFLCTDVNGVLNVKSSWTDSLYRFYAGKPVFRDGCDIADGCDCQTQIKVNDQIEYLDCNSLIASSISSKITRTFIATDCMGNATKVVQEIFFRRPALQPLFSGTGPREIVLRDNACSANKAEMLAAFKAGDYNGPKYIYDDPYSCNANDKYAYFPESVQRGLAGKTLACNYSFNVDVLREFPVCNNGLSLEVLISSFDWCTGKRTPLDTVILKWMDLKAPVVQKTASKPVVFSTEATSCTASFGVDISSLKDFFGIDVSDNCSAKNDLILDVQVKSCTYATVNGIVVGEQRFSTVKYPTSVLTVKDPVSGNTSLRNMVSKVPVGQHRLIITAYDKCNNLIVDSIDFTVLDRTAPVMKCTDQLTVTIANSSTSGPTNQFGGYGQTHPLTGYAVKGYAKVLVNEINRGSSDNCGMDWVRVRREIDPADASDVAFFVAAGYDSNGDGVISTADGVDWNSDGDINDLMEKFETNNTGQMMTPALDFVEFHCGDLTDQGGVMVELWGRDKETNILTCSGSNLPTTPATSGGNTNFCWMNIVVEDKVAPTFTRPWDAALTCYNREALDTLRKAASVSGGLDITSSTYKWIETNIFVAQGMGRFTVNSGDDCNALTVKATVNTTGINNCDSSGVVTITYSATKPNVQSGNATTTQVALTIPTAQRISTITVRRVHEYNLRFPQDVNVDCSNGLVTTRDTANVADGGELGCDILSVNVTDKRYNSAVSATGAPVADCYRIYRTFTVVNWCQYDDRCGEPMQWAVIVPRDPDSNNGNNQSTTGTPTGSNGVYTVANTGVNVLVRDLNRASLTGPANTVVYYEDAAKNLTGADNEVAGGSGTRRFVYNNTVGGANGSNCPDARGKQFAWMYTQYLYVTDRTAPVATINAATGTSIRKNDCLAPVSITFTATDACAGATGTESQNNTTANPSIAIERVRLRTYTSAYQGSASPSPVNSFQANEQASTIADVAGAQVSPSQALNLGTKNGGSWTYSANLARGWYGLIVVVRDDCGNLSTQQELTFRVVDDQPTSPICYNGLSTDLMTTPMGGRMEVWASDFIAERKVYDCTGTGVAEPSNSALKQLEKYWVVKDDNGDGNFDATDGLAAATNAQGLAIFVPTGAANNSVIFDCDDLGDVAVRLYTRDEAGNWAWCETFAKITDARGVCPSGPGTQSAAVAGAIATESNLNVEGVEVSLSGDATMTYATNVNGQYNFAGLRKGYDYTVTPQLDKNYLNGVSTFDLVLITKHILGVQPLNSPYKLIAADVNNSKSVTTLDLIQLRKLILNIDTKFANNTSWRFVDSSFKFANAANPWATQFPEVANLNDVAADVRANFVAVKIGDVNGNAVASSQVRTSGTFGLNVAEQALKAGNEYTVVFSGDLSQVEGYQFTLALDGNAVELVNLEAGIAVEENFGIFATEGVVTASWNGEAGNGNLFSLVVRAKADANLSEVLNLNSRYTAAEAYNKAGEQLNVALNFTGGQPVAAGFELKQNTPNPFAGETVVGFNLPVAGDATLTIQDVTGRTLRVIKGAYAQGYNQVILKSNDLKATGVLYYTLESGAFTATRKMVILE